MQHADIVLSELGRALNTQDIFERNNLKADEFQRVMLSGRHTRILAACSRQVGKSVACQALAVQLAALNERSTVIFVAPSQRQSQNNIRGCHDLIRGAGYENELAATKQLELEFKNRARIIGLPGKAETIRSFSNVSALIVDEAAFVDDEIFSAVMPFLAVNSDKAIFAALSSPHGRNNWFARQWHGENHWTKLHVKASDCPRISPEFLRQQRIELGDSRFEQEYNACFLNAEGNEFIPAEIVNRAFVAGLGSI